MLNWFKDGKSLAKRYVWEIVLAAYDLFVAEESMVNVKLEDGVVCDVIGDVHGKQSPRTPIFKVYGNACGLLTPFYLLFLSPSAKFKIQKKNSIGNSCNEITCAVADTHAYGLHSSLIPGRPPNISSAYSTLSFDPISLTPISVHWLKTGARLGVETQNHVLY